MKTSFFSMLTPGYLALFVLVACSTDLTEIGHSLHQKKIIGTKDLIAFWGFDQNKEGVCKSIGTNDTFPLYLQRIGDDHQYTFSNWPYTDESSKILIDNTGPLGNAIRFNQGYIYGSVPRHSFRTTALNVYGHQAFTLIAWVKFIGKRHLVAGIWDEGGWHKYTGRRQYALFAGLFNQDGVIAHLSSTGAASYPQSELSGAQYARIRAIDAMPFENNQWVAMAMSYDPIEQKIRAYLNGKMTNYFLNDPVVQDVYQHPEKQMANPLSFSGPIFHPKSFVLKFNGYHFKQDGIYEHRLWVDLENNKLVYESDGDSLLKGKKKFRITFDVIRGDDSILSSPLIFNTRTGDTIKINTSQQEQVGFQDTVTASLERQLTSSWQQVGTIIKHAIQPGAPFTVGRALGLASDEIDHGSQLYVDGIAIFSRVLSEQELLELSFME